MRNRRFLNILKNVTHWLLALVLAIFIITGYGITQFRIVEAITFGVVNKNISFRVHDSLIIPLIALLVLHILLAFYFQRSYRSEK